MSNLECEDEQATPSNSHPPLEVIERSSLSDTSQRLQEGASMEHASLLLSKRYTVTDEKWRTHALLVQHPCARPDVDWRARFDNPILHRTVPRQAVRYYPRPCYFESRLSPVVSSSTCPCVGWPSTRACRKRALMSWCLQTNLFRDSQPHLMPRPHPVDTQVPKVCLLSLAFPSTSYQSAQ